MVDSVYKVIELVGTSSESWEKAAKVAVERAAKSLRDLRVAEVVEQDLVISRALVGIFGAAGVAERLAERSIPKCKTTSLPRSASTSRVSLPVMPPPRRGSR